MEIENIKAQAREEIANLMPDADAATRESAVAVYLAGAVALAADICADNGDSRYGDPDYLLLSGEVRNLKHARMGNAG